VFFFTQFQFPRELETIISFLYFKFMFVLSSAILFLFIVLSCLFRCQLFVVRFVFSIYFCRELIISRRAGVKFVLRPFLLVELSFVSETKKLEKKLKSSSVSVCLFVRCCFIVLNRMYEYKLYIK
jgi:hypothetical protein